MPSHTVLMKKEKKKTFTQRKPDRYQPTLYNIQITLLIKQVLHTNSQYAPVTLKIWKRQLFLPLKPLIPSSHQ